MGSTAQPLYMSCVKNIFVTLFGEKLKEAARGSWLQPNPSISKLSELSWVGVSPAWQIPGAGTEIGQLTRGASYMRGGGACGAGDQVYTKDNSMAILKLQGAIRQQALGQAH